VRRAPTARALAAALAAASVCLATATPARADAVVLAPSQDASIFDGTAGSSDLADGGGPYLWLSVTAEGLNRRALLKFDVSSIPAGAQVREVRLTLYQSRSRESHAVAVHRLTRAWSQGAANGGSAGAGAPAGTGDVTWLHALRPLQAWTSPGGDHASLASASIPVGFAGQFYTWGPTAALVADVQSWVDQPAGNHGWLLIGHEQGQQNAKRFESRDNSEASLWPRLKVVYDPPTPVGEGDIPIPLWALALLAGAFGVRLWKGAR
jgi:hypothetical protein